jgi:hypothetical protein
MEKIITAAQKAVGYLWDIRMLIMGQIAGKIAALLERSMNA